MVQRCLCLYIYIVSILYSNYEEEGIWWSPVRLHTGRLHCTCFSFFITSHVSNQSSPWQNLIAQDSPAFLRFTHINHINTMHLTSTSEDIISLGPQTCLTTRDSKSTKIWRTEGLSRNTIALNCEVRNIHPCRNWMKPKQLYMFLPGPGQNSAISAIEKSNWRSALVLSRKAEARLTMQPGNLVPEMPVQLHDFNSQAQTWCNWGKESNCYMATLHLPVKLALLLHQHATLHFTTIHGWYGCRCWMWLLTAPWSEAWSQDLASEEKLWERMLNCCCW